VAGGNVGEIKVLGPGTPGSRDQGRCPYPSPAARCARNTDDHRWWWTTNILDVIRLTVRSEMTWMNRRQRGWSEQFSLWQSSVQCWLAVAD